MTFIPNPKKQAQEVIFSRKIKKTSHPPLKFNSNPIQQNQFQKLFDIFLDDKLEFCEHLQNIFKKENRTISLLRKLHNNLSRTPLVTIYKFLDCRDISYYQTFNNSFHEKLKSVSYNAALAITGAIRGSFREKLYQKPGFETLLK